MARDISVEVEIAATPEDVWAVLVDFAAYPEWNPYIVVAEGAARSGERLSLQMRVGGKTFTVRPKVIGVSQERELRWEGRLGIPGIFDADHIHRLEKTVTGTRYTQSERFTGSLVPFLGKTLEATEAAFVAMNSALKQRVETSPAGIR
ncbi:MAG TPA: SRPBCC domain-containing protein [Fimbriimonadaceae bacterium]|jgi:hypothetical protein|nr:SRPBCC domain-containing protein [Fimbriimonadaceae bacterium]